MTGVYARACTGCTSHISDDSARWADLVAAFFWGALFTAGIVGVTWLGAGLSILTRKVTGQGPEG